MLPSRLRRDTPCLPSIKSKSSRLDTGGGERSRTRYVDPPPPPNFLWYDGVMAKHETIGHCTITQPTLDHPILTVPRPGRPRTLTLVPSLLQQTISLNAEIYIISSPSSHSFTLPLEEQKASYQRCVNNTYSPHPGSARRGDRWLSSPSAYPHTTVWYRVLSITQTPRILAPKSITGQSLPSYLSSKAHPFRDNCPFNRSQPAW